MRANCGREGGSCRHPQSPLRDDREMVPRRLRQSINNRVGRSFGEAHESSHGFSIAIVRILACDPEATDARGNGTIELDSHGCPTFSQLLNRCHFAIP